MISLHTFRRLFVWTFFIILIGGIYLYRIQHPVESRPFFFPELGKKIDDVQEIKVIQANQELILKKQTDNWVLANKANLPVQINWLRELISGLVNMKMVEAKTQNPNVYPDIHVDLPHTPDSKAIRLQLLSNEAHPFLDLVIGKRQARPSHPESQFIFIRETEQAQSYLVESALPESFNLNELTQTPLFPINNEKITSLFIKAPDHEFKIVRKNPSDDFEVESLPAGKKLRSQLIVNEIANAVNYVTAIDLVALEELDLDWEQALQLQIKTDEKHQYQFQLLITEGKSWLNSSTLSGWAFEVPSQEVAIVAIEPDKLFEDTVTERTEESLLPLPPAADASEFEIFNIEKI